MLVENVLSSALATLNYVRQKEWVYRFAASEVDHYLYFVVRPDRRLIAAHFGFKNAEADEYSIRLFSRFAAPDFPADRMLETGNCSVSVR